MQKSKENHPGEVILGHNRTALECVAVDQLSVRPGDPRRFSQQDIALATAVVRQMPPDAPLPIVVNDNHEIMVGGLFVQATRKLGLKQINVIRHAGLSRIEEQQYSVAINQLLSKGGWDPGALDVWIREFEASIEDFSHESLGFSNGELDKILGIHDVVAGLDSEEALPPAETVAISQHGSIWQAGRHTIMVGDANSPADMRRLMAGHMAALALTDPPFGCKVDGFVSKKGKHRDFVEGAGDKSPEELESFFSQFAMNLLPALRAGALVYVFIDWRSLDLLLRACEKQFGRLVQFCCWVKDRAGMGSFYRSQHELVLVFRVPGAGHINNIQLGRHGRNRSNVWNYPAAASSRKGREGDMLEKHPTPKPVELIADAILDCTAHGDRIIDCFLGSGTALIAAERTGRICHGMDLDPLYVDVAIRRWQAWTGLTATDAGTGRSFDEIAAEAALREEHGDVE